MRKRLGSPCGAKNSIFPCDGSGVFSSPSMFWFDGYCHG